MKIDWNFGDRMAYGVFTVIILWAIFTIGGILLQAPIVIGFVVGIIATVYIIGTICDFIVKRWLK